MTPEQRKAKIEALRHLRDRDFYEPETDNPENLPLDEEETSEEQTMQGDPSNLMNALKRTKEQEMLDKLFKK